MTENTTGTQDAPTRQTSMPKRKPVPVPVTSATVPDIPTDTNDVAGDQKRKWPLVGLIIIWWTSQKRSRKLLIIGATVTILLIAIIIGLAVGLTVGKNLATDMLTLERSKKSKLPLPTSNGGPYSGDLTYYDPGLGACGDTNTASELICAVSHIVFDAASTSSNPNDNPLCGLKIRIRRDGQSVDVTVVDRCVGCEKTDLDVTEKAFEQVANIPQGRVTMEWAWLEKSPVDA
ncbi:uncharacterized protein N7484_002303 [Penicillium longicatenatum]|uniref:uncharacterized protein n=1 Tax=Penicillium longicatenatum TaxID=1561947 RepID=UPI0025479ABE|nr:uncharacterized protein N7484_002303 [Penicillium longicatenatum]KAJ5658654.1 hypothetical protein N7484_002303 [Penicillium longicatenatum]